MIVSDYYISNAAAEIHTVSEKGKKQAARIFAGCLMWLGLTAACAAAAAFAVFFFAFAFAFVVQHGQFHFLCALLVWQIIDFNFVFFAHHIPRLKLGWKVAL